MRDDYQRLLDIQEGIERIEKYTAAGREKFDANELVQTWVLHHLQIIGEAARSLSAGCKAKQLDIPWDKINGMRNILVHHYFGIDTEIVWGAVERELPKLKAGLLQMIERETPKPGT
ncbi:MAG TPA: HepT-like ribonuclease domain-containing protein [Verrucomicrobiae bacterium]|jgi:uncharacterized protein with HEPN domain|nr:HepT-like ribonuclease domain-containing protein [Verrucomicrobiae bacterium]